LRTVSCPPLDRRVSVLAFGCASLGSRIPAARGLRALAAACERGVTWFDVAPAYGHGQAEVILGQFLRSRRNDVVVCTKVGLAPGQGCLDWIRPAARTVLSVAPFARRALRSAAPRNVKLPITPALIEESVERSLARLGTDYVDVLALHDPEPDECADPRVIETLARMVASGRARTIGIAGSAASVLAGAGASPLYACAQISGSILSDEGDALTRGAPSGLFRISHGPFGVGGTLAALAHKLRTDPSARARLSELGYGGGAGDAAAAALLDSAFALNPHGVVLCSMFGERRLEANCRRATYPPNPSVAETVRGLLRNPS
jgi:aryl-alcohol dehydrogenase-like predicted oxidoreductase